MLAHRLTHCPVSGYLIPFLCVPILLMYAITLAAIFCPPQRDQVSFARSHSHSPNCTHSVLGHRLRVAPQLVRLLAHPCLHLQRPSARWFSFPLRHRCTASSRTRASPAWRPVSARLPVPLSAVFGFRPSSGLRFLSLLSPIRRVVSAPDLPRHVLLEFIVRHVSLFEPRRHRSYPFFHVCAIW
jgi:hypothetical protein